MNANMCFSVTSKTQFFHLIAFFLSFLWRLNSSEVSVAEHCAGWRLTALLKLDLINVWTSLYFHPESSRSLQGHLEHCMRNDKNTNAPFHHVFSSHGASAVDSGSCHRFMPWICSILKVKDIPWWKGWIPPVIVCSTQSPFHSAAATAIPDQHASLLTFTQWH